MKLKSLDIENNMLLQCNQIAFWFKNFPADMFLFGVSKNICTAPFLDAQELHSWSTLKENVSIFQYISVRKFCFKEVVRFNLMGVGWWKAE